MEHPILTKQFLIQQYVEMNKTQKEIAKEIHVSSPLVGIWMKKHGIKARNAGRQRPELVGKKIGSLKVLSSHESNSPKHPMWNCLCDCGQTCLASSNELCRNKRISCQNCSRKRTGEFLWKGKGEISGHFWNSIVWSGKTRNLDFNITLDYAWSLYIEQDKKCAITGCPIAISRNNQNTASLDRIDSSKGYVIGNVQWLHKRVNIMKSDMSEEELKKWCRLILDYQTGEK